jgi:hypothetical protein
MVRQRAAKPSGSKIRNSIMTSPKTISLIETNQLM